MANATKVAEIFDHAALAFGKLAYLTLELKQAQAHTNETESKPSCKWSNREIELLKDSIIRFGNDLAKISEIIETKTTNQIKAKMRNKAFQEAGIGEPPDADKNTALEPKTSTDPAVVALTEKGRRKQRLGEVLDDQPFKRVRYQETTETPSGAVPARDRSQFSGPSTNAPTLDDPCDPIGQLSARQEEFSQGAHLVQRPGIARFGGFAIESDADEDDEDIDDVREHYREVADHDDEDVAEDEEGDDGDEDEKLDF